MKGGIMMSGRKVRDGKILLVEDNQGDVELTLRALRKNNISNEVVVAKDGEEALNYLFCEGAYSDRDPCDLPVLILMDLKLPKVSGLEVLKRMRADNDLRLLPVVILTLSKEESDIIAGYNLGANSYVRKPIDFIEFMEAVKQLGIYWLILNEPLPKKKGEKNG
jgi:two-component system, response regulator